MDRNETLAAKRREKLKIIAGGESIAALTDLLPVQMDGTGPLRTGSSFFVICLSISIAAHVGPSG